MTSLNISDEMKAGALEASRLGVMNELYALCLRNLIDPDTLDLDNPLSNARVVTLSQSPEGSDGYYSAVRIQELCASYIFIEQKSATLNP